MHDLTIETRGEPTRRHLTVAGELDLASAWSVVDVVAKLCSDGARAIVLDIGALEFVDSTGLRAILRCISICREHHCELRLAPDPQSIPRQVQRLFEVTGLMDRLPFSGQSAGAAEA